MKRFERSSYAATATGDLVAIFGVEIGLDDIHATPITAKLFGDDHGERGEDALAHFGVAAPDFYFSGGGNFEPGVGSEWRARRRGFLSGGERAREMECQK